MNKLAISVLVSLLCASASIGSAQAAVKKAGTRYAAPATQSQMVKRTVSVRGRNKIVYQRVTKVADFNRPTMGDLAGLNLVRDPLDLKSNVALVLDQANSEVLFEKNAGVALPIASITKMMTGLVVVEANQDLDEMLTVTDDDVDREKFSSSRLKVGDHLTRRNMLHIALMSSENRAASALGRNYPGGLPAFVQAMNEKAQSLGMNDTHYVDSSGLSKMNVASARDLARLVQAAYEHPILREFSTDPKAVVENSGRPVTFGTTNRLVAPNSGWEIGLQKTGFINEAGRCMIMQAMVEGRAVIMVLLDAKGTAARVADATRMKKWLAALKPTFGENVSGASTSAQSYSGM
ncbi:serine hydrolase [Duganella sp. Root1480D1]|uniref:serine hydrolase n=1 Tax=Duganella sp. Root1480D1 TaxID=1736471 RepID=UPI00070FA383|nr:serine hydrolase [Duganella sp. Root1480D1]KQZ43436.1 peptidase S11 [Duganella sp. Root1480D1]